MVFPDRRTNFPLAALALLAGLCAPIAAARASLSAAPGASLEAPMTAAPAAPRQLADDGGGHDNHPQSSDSHDLHDPTLHPVDEQEPQIDPNAAGGDVGAEVEAFTAQVEQKINGCQGGAGSGCVANALDAYAIGLAKVRQKLPPQLRNLSNIVHSAAIRVRAAKTPQQASQALNSAIAAVRKSISLLKADDPLVLKAQEREGAFVVETLQVAQIKMAKAVGL